VPMLYGVEIFGSDRVRPMRVRVSILTTGLIAEMVDPHCGAHIYNGAANKQLAPPRRKNNTLNVLIVIVFVQYAV